MEGGPDPIGAPLQSNPVSYEHLRLRESPLSVPTFGVRLIEALILS